jgi:hypothetical protein
VVTRQLIPNFVLGKDGLLIVFQVLAWVSPCYVCSTWLLLFYRCLPDCHHRFPSALPDYHKQILCQSLRTFGNVLPEDSVCMVHACDWKVTLNKIWFCVFVPVWSWTVDTCTLIVVNDIMNCQLSTINSIQLNLLFLSCGAKNLMIWVSVCVSVLWAVFLLHKCSYSWSLFSHL